MGAAGDVFGLREAQVEDVGVRELLPVQAEADLAVLEGGVQEGLLGRWGDGGGGARWG